MDRNLLERALHVAKQIKANKLPYSQTVFFNECGTPACLAGYCTADHVLAQAGLRTRMLKLTNTLMPLFGKQGDELIGLDAMAGVFDISYDQARYIFGGPDDIHEASEEHGDPFDDDYAYGDIDNVIQRVQDVLDGWGQ